MPRLIDADALMVRLVRKTAGTANKRYTDGFNDALMKFRSMISTAPTIEAEPVKWIPVTERLPEPFVSVLVQMPGERPFPTVREGFITKDGIWHSALYDREADEVTHWMPMPQPPKDGGADHED